MAEFRMPSLGADMEVGTVYDWQVKPGDHVKRGDIIVEVETDKGVIDVEVFEDGVIEEILVPAGTEVPVGTLLALIGAEETVEQSVTPGTVEADAKTAVPEPSPITEQMTISPELFMAESICSQGQPMDQRALIQSLPEVQPPAAASTRRIKASPRARKRAAELGLDLKFLKGTGPGGAISQTDVEKAAQEQAAAKHTDDKAVRVSPVARRLAKELGVNLKAVKGTGPHGAISRSDVEQAVAQKLTAAPPAASPKPVKKAKVDPQTAMRRAIAAAMSRSNQDIPHYYLETRIDMSRALGWLEAENAKRSLKDRILPVVLLIKATAKALSDVPELNGYWQDDVHQPQEAIHIGFAIALRQGGLVTPAIHHADLQSLDELMATMRDLIMRTRSGRLRGSELTNATVTLTNLGDIGVEKVFGVIYPPQVALVGFGKMTEQVWAENGMMGIRPVLSATLAGDHRASDGRRGGQFLDILNNYLQEPEKL